MTPRQAPDMRRHVPVIQQALGLGAAEEFPMPVRRLYIVMFVLLACAVPVAIGAGSLFAQI